MRIEKKGRIMAVCGPAVACVATLVLLGGCVIGETPTSDANGAPDVVDVTGFDFAEKPAPAIKVQLTHDKKDGGGAPLLVTYTVSIGDLDPKDFIFAWDFGDGDKREEQWEEGEDPAALLSAKHDYKYKGEYCAKLVVIWREKLSVRSDALACVDVIQPAELVLSTVKLESPEVVGAGDAVTLTFDVANQGDTVVDSFETGVFLSKDATLDKADLMVHSFVIKGMESGLTGTAKLQYVGDDAVSFPLPKGVPNGHYWIFVHVDHELKVSEFNDLDNIAYATTLLQVDDLVSAKPDLTVTKPTLLGTEPTYSPGDNITYTMEIKNTGAGEAKNFNYSVFLSKDEKLDYAPDVPVAEIDINKQDLPVTDSATTKIPSLDAGASLPLTRGLSVPDVPDGTYCLIAKIDVDDTVFETDENNNIATCDTKIVVKKVFKQFWDLDLQSIAVAPKSTFLGGTVSVKYTVKNVGNQPSPAKMPVTIYFCPGESFNEPNCVYNKTTFELNALVAGQDVSGQQNVKIAGLTPVGTYSVHVRVDPPPAKFSGEPKGNNSKKFFPLLITATAKVDLVPLNVGFHPESVVAGNFVKVSYKITNNGSSGSSATKTAIAVSQAALFSRDAVKSGVNIVLDKINEAPVESGETVYRSATVFVPVGLQYTLVEHHLGVVLDVDDDEGAESAADALNNGAPAPNKLKVSGAQGGCHEDKHDIEGKKNDDKDNAAAITAGVVEGLALCGAEDWYSIKMTKGHSLFVTLKATELLWTSPIAADLNLDLIAPDGSVLDSIKGLGLAKKASALTVAAAGDHLIRIYPHGGGVQAHYVLEVKVEGPPEGVDLFASHLTAAPAATFPGGLLKTTLALTNLGNKAADPFVIRYMLSTDPTIDDKDTKLFDESFKDGLGAAQSVSFKRSLVLPVVQGGKYYLGALIDAGGAVAETDEKNNTVTSNSVQLNSKITCAVDSFSGNHTIDEAANISPEGKKYEKLNVCPGLEDWFAIKLPAGKALTVKVLWKQVSGNGIIGVQVVDPTKTGVVAGSANPQNTLAKLPYLQVGGTYYIHTYVLPEGAKPAQPYDYELEVTVGEPDPSDVCLPDVYESNGSAQEAKELGCGFASLNLCLGDSDWFFLDLVKDEKLVLDFQHPGNSYFFEIFADPEAKPLQKLTSSGKINFSAPADGKYYVSVTHKENDKKPAKGFEYTLKVDGGKGVDLLPEIKSLFPNKAAQNDDIFVSTRFSNECKTPAGAFDYCYWFSADNKLDDKDRLMLKKTVAKGLEGKTQAILDDKAPVPDDAKPGPAYVIVEVDCANQVTESQELNNFAAGALTVVKLCLPDLMEPNPSPNYASQILPGKMADLSLCPYDFDWYTFEAEAGETITISLEFDAKGGDLDMRLYEVGKFGSPVAVAKTKDVPEQLIYTATKSTKFYLRVNGFDGQSNAYDMFYCKKTGGSCYECLDSKQCDFAVGDFCNPQGKCQALGCTIGDDKTCDDGNSCTTAKCLAGVGCAVTILNAAPCSDGDACTLGETCTDKGVCTAAKTLQVTSAKAELNGHGSVMLPLGGGYRVLAGDGKTADGSWHARAELHGISQQIWGQTYDVTGGLAHGLADAVTRSDAGELMAVGQVTMAVATTPTGALVMRLSGSTGAVMNSSVIGGQGQHRRLEALLEVAVAHFVAVGQSNAALPADGNDGWLLRLKSDGTVVWQLLAGGNGEDALHDVALAGDGTLLGVGVNRDDKGAAGGWVVGVSDAGKLLWSKNLAAGGTQSHLWSIAVAGDVAAVGGGSDLGQGGALPDPTYQSWIVWLNGAGFAKEPALASSTILPATAPQDAAYKGTKVSQVHDLAFTPDGGLVAAGTTGAAKGAVGGFDGAIWVVDSEKKLSKTHPFGDKDHDSLASLWVSGGQIVAFGTADVEAEKGPHWYQVSVTPPAADCNDGNACTIDACKADKGCTHTPVKDGDGCGIGLSCMAGVCQ